MSLRLGSGADLVAIGRPVIYGLNLGGGEGVTSVFEHLEQRIVDHDATCRNKND